MTQTRRDFLKASAAFCAVPLAWLKIKPSHRTITVHNKSQYEGHVPPDIPMGEDVLCILKDGEWVPVATIEKWNISI